VPVIHKAKKACWYDRNERVERIRLQAKKERKKETKRKMEAKERRQGV